MCLAWVGVCCDEGREGEDGECVCELHCVVFLIKMSKSDKRAWVTSGRSSRIGQDRGAREALRGEKIRGPRTLNDLLLYDKVCLFFL